MRIFISYRRTESDALVTLLKNALELERRHQVFVDTQSLPPGIPFPQQLDEAIDNAEAVIAVIGPTWVRPSRTIADDWCYHELFRAQELAAGDPWAKPIVPLLHGRAQLPQVSELPPELAFLRELGRIEMLGSRPLEEELAAFERRLRQLERDRALKRANPKQPLAGELLGLSTSPPLREELPASVPSPEAVSSFAVALANELLKAGADLAYAGLDPNKKAWSLNDNFTYHLAIAAQACRSRDNRDRVINYLSPHLKSDASDNTPGDSFALRTPSMDYFDVLDVDGVVSEALAYTAMRKAAVNDCSARICVGGKASKYRGRLAGVIEEAWLSLQIKQPVFLIASFGGATAVLVDAIEGKASSALTLAGQIVLQQDQQQSYVELVDRLAGTSVAVSYSSIRRELALGWPRLNNGLTIEENRELASTVDPARTAQIIARGLMSLKRDQPAPG